MKTTGKHKFERGTLKYLAGLYKSVNIIDHLTDIFESNYLGAPNISSLLDINNKNTKKLFFKMILRISHWLL